MTEDYPPESVCQDCNGPNPVWFAPNEVWNRVMGSPYGFVCPGCFIARSEAGGERFIWRVAPERRCV